MAQKQIEVYRRIKGILIHVSMGKNVTVCEDKIKINIEYGKKVRRSYTVFFTMEEWRMLQRKVQQSFEFLNIDNS